MPCCRILARDCSTPSLPCAGCTTELNLGLRTAALPVMAWRLYVRLCRTCMNSEVKTSVQTSHDDGILSEYSREISHFLLSFQLTCSKAACPRTPSGFLKLSNLSCGGRSSSLKPTRNCRMPSTGSTGLPKMLPGRGRETGIAARIRPAEAARGTTIANRGGTRGINTGRIREGRTTGTTGSLIRRTTREKANLASSEFHSKRPYTKIGRTHPSPC